LSPSRNVIKEMSVASLSAFRSCVKIRFFFFCKQFATRSFTQSSFICTNITVAVTDPYTAWHLLSPLISDLFVLVPIGAF